MIRQGQERVLVSYLLDVIQLLSGYAVVQQLGVPDTGEHGALGGDVARDLDLAHDLADLDELRRAGVRMLFEALAFRPAIPIVVLPDIAEQEIRRRPCTIMRTPLLTRTDQKFLSLARSTRWNCSPGCAGLSCRSNAVVFAARCSSPFSRARLSVNVSAMRNCMRSGLALKWQSLQPLQPVPKVRALGADRWQADLEGGEGTHQRLLVFAHQRRNPFRRYGRRRVVA